MRKAFAAALLAGSVFCFGAAEAGILCGPGCNTAPYGGCVVDGWGILPRGTPNECPVGTRPAPACPRGFVWRFKACFPA
jgi:hypothetical protein